MPNSTRMGWAYPSENQRPWFDAFEDFVGAVDASGFAAREDRNAILSDGGTIGWSAGTSTLTWSSSIMILSAATGFRWEVAAGTATLDDGEILYATLNRSPTLNTTVSVSVASQMPSTDGAFALAFRSGGVLYFRNGTQLNDGDTITGIGGGSGGGGGGSGTSQRTVVQAAHGFTLTDLIPIPVCWDPVGSEWVVADQVPPERTKQAFLVEVVDANTFVVQLHGFHSLTPGHGLIDGDYYWLDTVAPYYTDVQPVSGIAQCLWVVEGDRLQLLNQAAYNAAAAGGGGKQTSKYIVGNALTGDTLAICDFLDPGDGTGVAAALAAANAGGGGDIWVRGGVYDFSTGTSPALPILMSTTTTIQGTPTNQLLANFFGVVPPQQTLFIIGDSRQFIGIAALPPPDFGIVDITDVVFQVNPVDVAASGTTLLLCYGRVTRCSFLLPNATDITETLATLVFAGAIDECTFSGTYDNGVAGGTTLVAFSSEIITNCSGSGVDAPAIIGAFIGQSPRMENCTFSSGNPYGVHVAASVSYFTISNCTLSASMGASLEIEGDGGRIVHCIIDSMTIAGAENQISNSRVADLTILVGATDTYVIGVFADSYSDLGTGTVVVRGVVGGELRMGAGNIAVGTGGGAFLNGGDSTTTGNGGDVIIAAGNADTGNGGVLQLESGKASDDGAGGDIYIRVGDSIGANAGGILTITAGQGAPGGNVELAGGAGAASGDSGGDVTITGGVANFAGAGSGGDVSIAGGTAAGAGVGGDISVIGGAAGPTGTAGSLTLDSGDLNGSSNGSTVTIGGTNATVVNIGNGDNSTTAIALRGLTTVSADEVTTGGTISARHLVLSSPDAAGVPDVSIYTSDVNPNGNLTALQGSLAISPAGLFRNTNGGTAWAVVHAGIDYVEGFVADAGTAANRRGYTRGSDPLSATPSFTAVLVGRILNTQFIAGGSRQLFGTRSAAGAGGGGWCIFSEGTVIGLRFTDTGGVQRSTSLVNATLAWRVLHLTVAASGADLTLTLFANGAQVSEVYVGGAGGQYTAGAEMCVGVLDEGAILPAALHNRIHGAGYATATMTQAEVAAHAEAIIEAGMLVQTPSGTALADGWRADVALGTPAAATWASFLGGTDLTTLNTTALTLASQSGPIRWV